MKRLLFLLFFVVSVPIIAQRPFRYTAEINGYWGKWRDASYISKNMLQGYVIQGTYDNFIIYNCDDHPSCYNVKITINGMTIETDKKVKEYRIKNNLWYQYDGTIEYFNESNPPCPISIWGNESWVYRSNNASTGASCSESVKIIIAPYKKNPEVYNILSGNNGLGIHLLNRASDTPQL